MVKTKKRLKNVTSLVMAVVMVLVAALPEQIVAQAATSKKSPTASITYKFTGKVTPGFAQGTITLKSKVGGKYYLYWANN